MGLLSARKISEYYEAFRTKELTFSKDTIQATGLLPEHVHLKCGSDFWPCVFSSTSLECARVVANVHSGLPAKLASVKNSVSLRLSFRNPDGKGKPVTFFIAGRISGSVPHKGSEDISLMSIQFTQRPPDDFIEIVGRVLDAFVNSAKRKDERLIVTPEFQRRIKLVSRESFISIQKVPRRCIIRDISFSGSKLILMGVGKFLVEKEATLRMDFEEPRESFLLAGTFVRCEDVEGKQGMAAVALEYDKAQIPTGYKMRINEYLGTVRADSRTPPPQPN